MFCPNCQTENSEDGKFCTRCGLKLHGPIDEGVTRTAGMAIASLILGVLSLFCLSCIAGIPAVILGFIAKGEIERNPETLTGKGYALTGIILGLLSCLYIFLPLAGMFPAMVMPGSGFWNDAVRARSAAANAEMRNMAVSMESYYIDYEMYPYAAQGDTWAPVIPSATDAPSVGYTPRSLTTPVVHISSLPDDPFNRGARQNPDIPKTFAYRYAAQIGKGWILASNGPDKDADMDLAAYVDPKQADCDIEKYLLHFGGTAVEYDPTNGKISNGDIYRTGP